jgi:pimeloyl-ACP methyl ester carboxylesterase
MRPLFERYRGDRPVHALDLPGFGFSERGDRRYSPALYARAIADFLEQIGADRTDGADVVALSLGGELAARAAYERPALVRSLALISPTGFGARDDRQRAGRGAETTGYRLLAFPLWSQAFYDLLTSRASIGAFLKLCFAGHPNAGLMEYDYATAHRPGARFAPLRFVSGQLFTPDIRESAYGRLTQPVLALYDEDPFARFDALEGFVRRHENWRAVRIAGTKGLPQFERPLETVRALDAFWQRAPVAV